VYTRARCWISNVASQRPIISGVATSCHPSATRSPAQAPPHLWRTTIARRGVWATSLPANLPFAPTSTPAASGLNRFFDTLQSPSHHPLPRPRRLGARMDRTPPSSLRIPIRFTDSLTGRTLVSQLFGRTKPSPALTDNDAETYTRKSWRRHRLRHRSPTIGGGRSALYPRISWLVYSLPCCTMAVRGRSRMIRTPLTLLRNRRQWAMRNGAEPDWGLTYEAITPSIPWWIARLSRSHKSAPSGIVSFPIEL